MLIDSHSNIVIDSRCLVLPSGEPIEALTLINQQILVLSHNALSLYVNLAAIDDPLGNGLLHSVALPDNHALVSQYARFMALHRAGMVGLFDDKVILITPNDIQLFPSRLAALKNEQEIARLNLL